ncbi:MAG: DUF2177 family protein [Gammaproteobacteria bacterium]|nr:DUF2177 family protein [Gammaproteobacteria bacterium]
MKIYVIAYFATLIAFLIIDGIWLGVIAKNFYASQLGDLMRKPVLFAPAAVFYLFYAAGIVVLVIRPNLPALNFGEVAFYGAVLGFLAYGTYDVTNWATLKNWPPLMSLVDVIWGTALTSLVAIVGAGAAKITLSH